MKDKRLFIQLTILFSILVVFVGLAFITIVPSTLKSFFTDEIYHTIEETQYTMNATTRFRDNERRNNMGMSGMQGMHGMQGMQGMHGMQQTFRSVEHVFINSDGDVLQGNELSVATLAHFYKQAAGQQDTSARYELKIADRVMFYIIYKEPTETGELFQISYMWDTYEKELSTALLKKIYVILLFVLLVSLVFALVFAKRIVKPIEYMKLSVARIAKRNWDEELSLDRTDELGELAQSIDDMRVQLKEQDEAEKMFLQQVSHDLKTPVMVIRSYVEAMKDGIYPTGSIEGTADVIDKEAKNLEKKVKDLLLITKLDYLNDTKLPREPVSIDIVLEKVLSRLAVHRDDIHIKKQIEPVLVTGNMDQMTVLFENLLDNALKYAESQIELTSWQADDFYMIRCMNDGEVIDEEIISRVFQPFVKGKQGNFGLGLTIMKRIVDLHEGAISIEIVDGQTVVLIKLPMS